MKISDMKPAQVLFGLDDGNSLSLSLLTKERYFKTVWLDLLHSFSLSHFLSVLYVKFHYYFLLSGLAFKL